MTCRCEHEFCYLCEADWVPRKCSHDYYENVDDDYGDEDEPDEQELE